MVQFNTIEIIKLHIVLGDNPSCKDGPPIQASWDAFERIHMDLDDFESIRTRTRHSHCHILSSQERVRILRRSGFEYDAIEMAATATTRRRDHHHLPRKINHRRSQQEQRIAEIEKELQTLSMRLNSYCTKLDQCYGRQTLSARCA
jgi:DNA-binding transcriptional MerR regulator